MVLQVFYGSAGYWLFFNREEREAIVVLWSGRDSYGLCRGGARSCCYGQDCIATNIHREDNGKEKIIEEEMDGDGEKINKIDKRKVA